MEVVGRRPGHRQMPYLSGLLDCVLDPTPKMAILGVWQMGPWISRD